jgi:hypothetical protein
MKTLLYTPVLLTIALAVLTQVSAQTDPTTNASSATPTNTNSCSGQFGGNGWHHHGGGFALLNLTPAEQQQLAGDFLQIKDNPQFVAAAQAVAQSTQTLIQTSTSLIVQTDPSAAPILAKIQPQIAQLIQKAQLAQMGQLSQTNN